MRLSAGRARGGSLILGGLAVLVTLVTATMPAEASPEFYRSQGIQPPQEEVEAPDFSLSDPDGRTVRLRDYRGRHVFLNFFATWCGPCREEMPAMERLHQTYKGKGLTVLAVDLQEGPRQVAKFVRELRLSFPALLDREGAVSHEYAVRGLPVTFLIAPDGRIVWRAVGSREWDGPTARTYFGALLTKGSKGDVRSKK
jgi:peroxiredoxin